jgi:hypothetical protein
MSASDVYDFEFVIEMGAFSILTVDPWNLDVYTSTMHPDFEKDRPRVELKYLHGAGRNIFLFPEMPAGLAQPDQNRYRRETTWDGRLMVDLVTAADPKVHAQYRATVRAALAALLQNFNDQLNWHKVQATYDVGTSSVELNQDEGFYRTQMVLAIVMSLQANAFEQITK